MALRSDWNDPNRLNGRHEKELIEPDFQALFAKAFQESPDLLAISRLRDGVVLYVNQRFYEVTELSEAEVIGRSTLEIAGLWLDANERNEVLQELREKPLVQRELLCRRRDGRSIWADFSARLMEIDGEQYMLTSVRDITEENRTTKIVTKWVKIFANAEWGVGIITIPENRLYLMNPAFTKMYGYTAGDELSQCNLLDLIASGNHGNVMRALDLADQTGYASFEAYHLRKDGSTFPGTVNVTTVREEAGRPFYRAIHVRDISERKKADEELRYLKDKYSVAFHTSPDAININRLVDGLYIDINQGFTDLTGFTWDDCKGKTALEIDLWGDPTDRPRLVQILKEKGKATDFEFSYRKKNGEVAPGLMSAAIIEVDREKCILSITRDITERKQTEAEIRKLTFNDKLTGLYNRTYLEEELANFDRESNLPISIVMGDINGLKLINDGFGHAAGDQLLKSIAQILVGIAHPEDRVIRWGGDEFLILMPRTDLRMTEKMCLEIKQRCADNRIRQFPASIALGFAVKEEPSQSIHLVLNEADDRMYRNKLLENQSARSALVQSLLKTLAEKSHETEQHAERLWQFAQGIGERIALPPYQMDDLALLATLHDIGKIGIPEDILNKPGSLKAEEWDVMRKHPDIGYRIVQSIPDLASIVGAIRAHHERWDGKGYPQGLSGEEIPLISRILAIVDAYDAMTQNRVYRNAVSRAEALREIKRCAGSQFDPMLAKVFLTIMESGKPDQES